MIRVLIVDDSPTARALLTAVLGADPQLQVVGEARDGVEAVALTQKLRPDVVSMDIHMPRLDGFAATKEIMITAPTPIVIATGSTQAGEVVTAMHALRAGALAVVQKPRGPDAPNFAETAARLISTLKSMSQVKVVRHWRSAQERLKADSDRLNQQRALVHPSSFILHPLPKVVAVAASTGGPGALQQMLEGLPGDFPVPILVVQHIATGFTAGLAVWLNTVCDLRVKVAEPGELLRAHTVYVAPDDRHLGVTDRAVAVAAEPPVGGFRPAATYLFESVARSFGSAAVAVILTGMGEDGVQGLREIRRLGGRVLAQDEASCVVFGMPAAAIAAGLADEVLPLAAVAPRLVQLVRGA